MGRSNMQRVKAHELRLKDETACVEELQRHRKELASLRVSKVAAAPRSSSPKYVPCARTLPRSLPSSPKSAELRPEMPLPRRDTLPTTCARRKPVPSEEN